MSVQTIDIKEAIQPLAEYAQLLQTGPLLVTQEGEPVAALIAVGNMDAETISLSQNPQFLEIIERSRLRQKAEGGISSSEMRRQLGLI